MEQLKPIPFRHERKHLINLSDYIVLRQRLSVVAKRDENTQMDGLYKIRSLYFDNFQDKALREKLDGVNNREKFRIRYYNNDPSFIRLGKKMKCNGLCGKLSAPLSREQCERLLRGNLTWMISSEEPLIRELFVKMRTQMLRPRVVVDYLREAYVYAAGNVRITLDSSVKTGLHQTGLFEEIPMISADEGIILEVKYDHFLPSVIADIIQLGSRRETAYSKYAVGRMFD